MKGDCMTTPKTIRNAAGGDSRYTLSRGEEQDYIVNDTKTGEAWTVGGWNGSVSEYSGYDKLPATSRRAPRYNPPAYTLAAVERERARDQLREILPPGSTVYTILHQVGRSGMSRRVGVRAIVDGEPMYLDGLIHAAEPSFFPLGDREGIIMGGCGMDMGFHLVYSLSRMLYRDAFDCIGEDCPSNDHSNGDRDYTPHKHSDGGYALRQRWI